MHDTFRKSTERLWSLCTNKINANYKLSQTPTHANDNLLNYLLFKMCSKARCWGSRRRNIMEHDFAHSQAHVANGLIEWSPREVLCLFGGEKSSRGPGGRFLSFALKPARLKGWGLWFLGLVGLGFVRYSGCLSAFVIMPLSVQFNGPHLIRSAGSTTNICSEIRLSKSWMKAEHLGCSCKSAIQSRTLSRISAVGGLPSRTVKKVSSSTVFCTPINERACGKRSRSSQPQTSQVMNSK